MDDAFIIGKIKLNVVDEFPYQRNKFRSNIIVLRLDNSDRFTRWDFENLDDPRLSRFSRYQTRIRVAEGRQVV